MSKLSRYQFYFSWWTTVLVLKTHPGQIFTTICLIQVDQNKKVHKKCRKLLTNKGMGVSRQEKGAATAPPPKKRGKQKWKKLKVKPKLHNFRHFLTFDTPPPPPAWILNTPMSTGRLKKRVLHISQLLHVCIY